MRRLLAALLAIAGFGAFEARAAPIVIHSPSLILEIGSLPPIVAFGDTPGLSQTVAPGAFPVPAFTLTDPSPVSGFLLGGSTPTTLFFSDLGVASGFLSLSGGPGGGVGGILPLGGTLRLSFVGGLIGVTVPLSVVGQGGSAVGAVGDLTVVRLLGGVWTTGPVVITGVASTTPGTAVVNTVTRTGSAFFGPPPTFPTTLTNGGTGNDPVFNRLRLVAPMPLVIDGTRVAGFATLELLVAGQVLLPEPGTLGLLLTGAGGLALLGLRRARARSTRAAGEADRG